jgi:drug/metabolite transporter (DMT)-like permease
LTLDAARSARALPVAALVVNAFVWGVSWWPFRQLEAWGLHALWATTLIYGLAVVVISWRAPAAWRELLSTPSLWVLVLAAGTTNATFNWAVTIGDVVRVVLLFYLMPLWAVLLARLLLGERLSALAAARVLMALAGAAVVLWPLDAAGTPAIGMPLPRALAEWLALLGGFSFALNNVMLRREAARSSAARSLAMFAGGMGVAGALAWALSSGGAVPWPPAPAPAWLALSLVLGVFFLLGNLALQYGASRLPAHVTAVVMLSEILFASGSAIALGAGVLTAQLALGALLILGASLLSTYSES